MFGSLQKSFAKATNSDLSPTHGHNSNDDQSSDAEDDLSLQDFSRSELLQRIQDLTERNERFERRFRDVVGAYKNILTEKSALEETVSALTNSSTDGPSDETADTNGDDENVDNNTNNTNDGDGQEQASANGSDAATNNSNGSNSKSNAALQKKIAALAKVVATLTEEKKTMQTRFQDDKRIVAENHRAELDQMIETNEKSVLDLQQSVASLEKEKASLQSTVTQVSEQLQAGHAADKKREQDWERIKAQHKVELAGIKKSADDGKTSSKVVELKTQLQTARDSELDALTQLSTASTELKDRITSLEEELMATKDELLNAHTETGNSDEILQLKQEISTLQRKCKDWQQRATGAEQDGHDAAKAAQESMKQTEIKLAQYRATSEETLKEELQKRILLENRLSELAAMVGEYESARVADSGTIATMNDECAELRQQLKGQKFDATSEDLNATSEVTDDGRSELLQAQILKLKSMLGMANRQLLEVQYSHDGLEIKTELPTPSWESKEDDATANTADSLTNQKLQMEAKMFYRKAQLLSTDLAKARKDLSAKENVETHFRAQLLRLQKTRVNPDDDSVEQWKTECLELRTKLQSQETSIRKEHEDAINELRGKISKMRDRALSLVRDRDTEIARLRHSLKLESKTTAAQLTSPDELNESSEGSARKISSHPGSTSPNEKTLHDQMQQKQAQSGAASARQKLREMESTIADGKEREDLLADKIRGLTEEVRRLQRNARREGANLEYLKNILVRYMSYQAGKDQTLIAIATILQFSPRELSDVRKSQPSTWWPSSPTKSK